jgi:hypothetical protein
MADRRSRPPQWRMRYDDYPKHCSIRTINFTSRQSRTCRRSGLHHIPLPATFRFEFCGRRFGAAIRSQKSSGSVLLIRCLLGHIPFSAETVESRRQIQLIVDTAKLIENTDVTVDKSNALDARPLMSFSSKPPPSYVVAGTAV